VTDPLLRVVVDTNVLLSFLIKRDSVPGTLVTQILDHHRLLLSAPVMQELAERCRHDKFRPYFTVEEGTEFVELIEAIGELVPIRTHTTACRDAKDNMVLDLALSGRADLLVSGDKDLTAMGRFEGIPILSPKDSLSYLTTA
jgi:putative PIN family toxin of toxin-antitoxin system